MKVNPRHIETAMMPGPAGASYSPMYSMHKYWSKKPSEIIDEYIRTYTDKGDIVLDPFVGYGVTAFEAIKLGRRAVAIELNPMATFITRVILEPVNLSHLQWAFRDIQHACESSISELFATRCPRCSEEGIVDFVIRNSDDPIQIAYTCTCTGKRLFKEPDEYDRRIDNTYTQIKIPFWYPENVPLPTTQKESFEYVHELFTRRNLIALSTILHAIESLDNERVRNVMKLAFTAALDKCSRLKPLSKAADGRPTLSEGWVATRFYTPREWQEVNPWKAFKRSFERAYEGKKESNAKLSNAIVGSSFEDLESRAANVVILQGSSDEILKDEIPEHSIDYVLTDPPFGSAIQYLTLSTFWGAWLGFDFDYEREIVVDPRRQKKQDDYDRRMRSVFHVLGRVTKPGSYVHVFYNDIKGPFLHKMLNFLEEAGIAPQHILHQPPPNSFGVVARAPKERRGHYGSYVIRGLVSDDGACPEIRVSEDEFRRKLAEAARAVLEIQGGKATVGTILHSVYQQLDKDGISTFAKYPAESFLLESISEFAQFEKGQVKILDNHRGVSGRDITEDLRRAICDARSLLANERDNINRVRQLTLSRFGKYGITPETVSAVEEGIDVSELNAHGRKRFADLLSSFGRKLGFQSNYPSKGENIVTWIKGNSLECNFELGDKDIRVFSSALPTNVNAVAEWGTIPYIKMERKLWEWSRDNPDKGHDMIQHLNPLDGPSYELLTRRSNGSNGFRHLKLKVLKNIEVCPGHNLMQVQLPNLKLNILPGQFFHIVCDPDKGKERGYPLTLRRPFSIHGAQYSQFDRSLLARSGEIPKEIRDILERWPSKIDFLYKVVGAGTKSLSRITEGTVLAAIGPCGNGFSTRSESIAVIVAGGIGVAPLIGLVERLRYLDKEVYIYLGALRRELLNLAIKRPDSDVELSFANGNEEFLNMIRADFQEIGAKEIRVCTDDGSVGYKGFVTQLLDHDFSVGLLPRTDVCLYACGPHDMLRSVSEIARIYSIECQVLLEERMACGIGACLSCVCDVVGPDGTTQKKRVCRDGPIFSSAEIKWKD